MLADLAQQLAVGVTQTTHNFPRQRPPVRIVNATVTATLTTTFPTVFKRWARLDLQAGQMAASPSSRIRPHFLHFAIRRLCQFLTLHVDADLSVRCVRRLHHRYLLFEDRDIRRQPAPRLLWQRVMAFSRYQPSNRSYSGQVKVGELLQPTSKARGRCVRLIHQ